MWRRPVKAKEWSRSDKAIALYRQKQRLAAYRRARAAPITYPVARPAGIERTGGYYGRFTGKNAELKFFDTTNNFLCDITGEVPATGQLALIPQGTTESTRIGRKVQIKSIQIRGVFTFNPAATNPGADTVHMYLILDTQCNGAAATVPDVFTGTALREALPNIANSQRFTIIKKFTIKFQSMAGIHGALTWEVTPLDYYKKCSIPIEYSSTTGAITEIRSNNLFFIAGTSAATDDLIQFNGTTRLRYSDQ